MVWVETVTKLQTFVWIFNHVSRGITWYLFNLSNKFPVSTWPFIWWCQFIDKFKFKTHPSSLRNSEMANKYLNIIGIYLKIDKTVKMRMCTYLTKRCVCEPSQLSKMAFIGWRLETVGNLSTRVSWYHGRQPEVFLPHDSHCACQDVHELRSRSSKREFSGWKQGFKFWVLRWVFVIQK